MQDSTFSSPTYLDSMQLANMKKKHIIKLTITFLSRDPELNLSLLLIPPNQGRIKSSFSNRITEQMAMQIFRITTSQQNILPIPSHFMFLLYRATYNSTRMVMFFRELPFFPTYKSLFINSPISKISLTKSVFIP